MTPAGPRRRTGRGPWARVPERFRQPVKLIVGGLFLAASTQVEILRVTLNFTGSGPGAVASIPANRFDVMAHVTYQQLLIPVGAVIAAVGVASIWDALENTAVRSVARTVTLAALVLVTYFYFHTAGGPLGTGGPLDVKPSWGLYLALVGSVVSVAGAFSEVVPRRRSPAIAHLWVACPNGHSMPAYYARCGMCGSRLRAPRRAPTQEGAEE